MWGKIGKALLKVGAWCIGNVDTLEAIIQAIISSKKEKEKKNGNA